MPSSRSPHAGSSSRSLPVRATPGPLAARRLEIRLLGGFEVALDGRPVLGFESQKVRALLAILAVQPGAALGREHLASLLWPEHEPAGARSSLRQALYNLRGNLGGKGSDPAWRPILATHQTVTLAPGPEVWIDVAAFERALRLGWSDERPDRRGSHGRIDPEPLARAVDLYRGDLFAGYAVRDSEELESWLAERRERLRESAVQALRALIGHHRDRGDYRAAIQHAHRLLGIDPLAEETHRHLMQLYALSGRRGRALSQYEDLRLLLDRELGVEPDEESQALYRAILNEEQVATARGEEAEPVGPFIPLVGRERELAVLRRIWDGVRQGRGAFTLIEGEPGVGKSRLIKSFLSEAERDAAAVLVARCHGPEPEVPYQPIREALRNEIASDTEAARWALGGSPGLPALPALPDGTAAEIARLLPELEDLDSGSGPLSSLAPAGAGEAAERRAEAVWQVLCRLTGCGSAGRRPRPVLLLLDDLHWADRPTLGLLERLASRLAPAPVWIVGTAAAGWQVEAVDPLARLRAAARESHGGLGHLALERLGPEEVRRIAAGLVGEAEAPGLADLYERYAGGLPLALTELTNLLADEGILIRSARGGWTAGASPAGFRLPEAAPLQEIVLRRVSRLPTSTRRLITLAAVLGHRFDASLLREVEREHMTVVECALEMLLDRWLIRHSARQWFASRRERDIVLWANGARRGTFEFSHETLRRAIYDSLDRTRRRVLHRQVAEALEQRAGDDKEAHCEALAYHYARAGAWDRTVFYVKLAAERASRLDVEPDPAAYLDLAAEARPAARPRSSRSSRPS